MYRFPSLMIFYVERCWFWEQYPVCHNWLFEPTSVSSGICRILSLAYGYSVSQKQGCGGHIGSRSLDTVQPAGNLRLEATFLGKGYQMMI